MPIQAPIKPNQNSAQMSNVSVADYKKIAFALLLFGAAAILLIIVAYPLYNSYQDNTNLINQEKIKIADLDTRLAQLDKIKRIAGSIDSTSKLALQAVPDADEIPVVMAMVQEISKKSGVKIADFSYAGMDTSAPVPVATDATGTGAGISDAKPQATGSVLQKDPTAAPVAPTTAKENFDTFKMQLAVKGKFDDVKKLINNLEQSRRILDIVNFGYSIQTGETQIVGDVLTLKLTISSYFKKFDNITTNVDLDKYSALIKKLESLEYTEIDLSNPNIGKIDPFSGTSTPVPTVSGTPSVGINNVETGKFFNSSGNSTDINVVELEGTGKTVTPTPENDTEAAPGDTTKLLQDLMKKEGL